MLGGREKEMKNMKIHVALPTDKKHRELLESACPNGAFVYREGDYSEDSIADADVIIGNLKPDMIPLAKNLKLLQLGMAGSDIYKGRGRAGLKIANASGAYGLAISEHMLAALFMLMKKLHLYRDNQAHSLWRDEGQVTSIEGARVLVVGLGDIGGEFAKRCRALGAYTIGIRRTHRQKPDFVDEVHTLDTLDALLPTADVVALALPQSDETKRLFDEARLNSMKKGAILLNVGRGSAIDTDALVKVLNEDRILASVDVTDPEPLPEDHPLWRCKNCLITPHISGFYHLKQTHDRIISIAARNLYALTSGGELMNVVDDLTGYRSGENRA